MLENFIIWSLGFVMGAIFSLGLGFQWFKSSPIRIKAALLGIVDALAKHYEGDNFEVFGTLVIGEQNALAVRVFVSPSEMVDAIATYALKDVNISRIRRKPDEHPTSQENPSCKSKALRDLSHRNRP